MARSLNRVQLIGNLTRDPELRYTPTGAAVVSFGLATNRGWTTESGEKKEETEFHRIVAWNKLAELCSQFLLKGRKVYVEGRLVTRTWTTQDAQQRSTTEIVIDNMILLDSPRRTEGEAPRVEKVDEVVGKVEPQKVEKEVVKEKKETEVVDESITADDIPF
ncbi:MAG: single-stranded DNA-binding protein [Patescibacteria group bacterium]